MSRTHIGIRKQRTTDEWHRVKHLGSCFGKPWLTHLFYPGQGENQTAAMNMCHGSEDQDPCPILQACLETHLEEDHGIWGGTSERRRQKLAAQFRLTGRMPIAVRHGEERRGRPRKIA